MQPVTASRPPDSPPANRDRATRPPPENTGQPHPAPKIRAGGTPAPKRSVYSGCAYVLATFNNTVVTFTDPMGNVLSQSSAGRVGFRGPKKATPYAAGVIVRQATAKVLPYGLREVNVYVSGFGSGREAAIRAINSSGITVLGIKDLTPLPHNGCRPKQPRRI